jgi:hypothetical protein
MTWFDNPRISKAEAVQLLPPGACRHCINFLRGNIGNNPDMWGKDPWDCPRCGTNLRPILEQFFKGPR